MSEFPLDRRDLLKTGAITLAGSTALTKGVRAENTSGGEEVWSFETGSVVRSSPTVIDGIVYVGSADSNVYALDAADGSERRGRERIAVVRGAGCGGGTVLFDSVGAGELTVEYSLAVAGDAQSGTVSFEPNLVDVDEQAVPVDGVTEIEVVG